MQKFDKLTGVAAPLNILNIDTDMIIPKQFLKTIKRSGLGVNLFHQQGQGRNEGPVGGSAQQRLCIHDQQSENLQGLLQGGFHLSTIRTIESGDDADLCGGTDGQSLQEFLPDGIRH